MKLCKITLLVLVNFLQVFICRSQLTVKLDDQIIANGANITVKANVLTTFICEGKGTLYWKTPNILTREKETAISIKRKFTITDVGYYSCLSKSDNFTFYLFVDGDVQDIDTSQTIYIEAYTKKVTIPCKPPSPKNITVLKNGASDIEECDIFHGCTVHLADSEEKFYNCYYNYNKANPKHVTYKVKYIELYSHITSKPTKISEIGKNLTLKCQVNVENASFSWKTPNNKRNKKDYGVNSSTLTIDSLASYDNGTFICEISKEEMNVSVTHNLTVYEKGHNILELNNKTELIEISLQNTKQYILKTNTLKYYPNISSEWTKGKFSLVNSDKYQIRNKLPKLKIVNLTLEDSGVYTYYVWNDYQKKQKSFILNITDKPHIELDTGKHEYHADNSSYVLTCKIYSNPPPKIVWNYKNIQSTNYLMFQNNTNVNITQNRNGFNYTTTLRIMWKESIMIKCSADNTLYKVVSKEVPYYISDMRNGFEIYGFGEGVNLDKNNLQIAASDKLTMTCGASNDTFNNINWYFNNEQLFNNSNIQLTTAFSKFSRMITINIQNINTNQAGSYMCRASGQSKFNNKTIKVEVKGASAPSFKIFKDEVAINYPNPISFSCNVTGLPKPTVRWLKDRRNFNPTNKVVIDHDKITFMKTETADDGDYTCVATNKEGTRERQIKLTIKNMTDNTNLYIIMSIISIIFSILIVYLGVRLYKERKLQRILKRAGLANFEKGALDNINSQFVIDEQAEFLPYDKKWEFPFDKLTIGKKLGSGNFGVVLKAEAKGLLENDEKTVVAVKMVKKTATDLYIKALASELKIMVHLGQHLNVVNLLGACTKNVAKRELYVIVEYCKFGNLQNYIFRHRANFINQIDPITALIDYSIGMDLLNTAHSPNGLIESPVPMSSRSTTSSGAFSFDTSIRHNSCGSSGHPSRYVSRLNSIQPEWRSNYKGDYGDKVSPICTKDLLIWSFQTARGMEYLSSRKILHGDLASRNILLAENNIAKICDFGLAKNMYNSKVYVQKKDIPLPFKWMAIESQEAGIFSTQSDIWAFGIVLWEFFSLSSNPYPGILADDLLKKLQGGYRMEQTEFCPNQIYQLMKECWRKLPRDRPSFTNLAEEIGFILEENVKEYYIGLNDPYEQMNRQHLNSDNDYLQMGLAPDFENLSSPLQESNENIHNSYIPMTPQVISSPREEKTFDFTTKMLHSGGTCTEIPLHTINENETESEVDNGKNSIENPSYKINDSLNVDKHNYINLERDKMNNKEVVYVNSNRITS